MPGDPFDAREIVLGVSGGIAAYKAADLVSRLRQRGAEVTVVMTETATRLIQPMTFAALSGRAVVTDLFEHPERYQTEHIALAQRAALAIVAPATANVLAKMAAGIADDALTTTLISLTCPVVVAPAMNVRMWESRATQDNRRTLRERGVHIVEPEEGWLACGERGAGRLAGTDAILQAAEALLS